MRRDIDRGEARHGFKRSGRRRRVLANERRDLFGKTSGRFQRRFEELRLDDVGLVIGADSPEALRDFGWWQDPAWRRATLALH